jgi:hypothetical protein
MRRFREGCRQALSNRVTSELPVNGPEALASVSRNRSPKSVGRPRAGRPLRPEKQYARVRLRQQIHPRDPKIKEFTCAIVSPVCDELLRGFA